MILMRHAILRLAAFFVLIVLLQVAFASFPLGRETKRRLQHALTGHALVQISYFLPEAYCKMGISIGAVGIWLLRGALTIGGLVALQPATASLALERETKRRLQHALTGCALALASEYFPRRVMNIALTAAAAGLWYLARFRRDAFCQVFGPLLRPAELAEGGSLPGAFYFLVGTVAVGSWFPPDVANYALLCLSLADPMASWVGRSIRSPMITSSASVAGSAACFVTAWLVGFFLLAARPEYSSWSLARGALGCTLAEAAAVPLGINDNLLLPLVTAGAIQGIR